MLLLKKQIFFSLLFSVFVSGAFSQPAITSVGKITSVHLTSSTEKSTQIDFITGAVSLIKVQTPSGIQYKVELNDATPILKKGAPDLPKLTSSIIIPDDGLMSAVVISSSFTDYENVFIAPSKGTLTRSDNPALVPFTYGEEYSANQFFPSQIVTLREPYILRDWRGQTVVVNPVQYNPVTKVLRVYSRIRVEVKQIAEGAVVVNPYLRTEITSAGSQFNAIYQNRFLNFKTVNEQARYIPVTTENKMLIICYGPLLETMTPFVEWKQQEGIHVDIVDVRSIGTRGPIKDYVADYYNKNGLTYLLLVGDAAQVSPGFTSAGTSDNDYAYIVGNDHYPDIFVGRFSAQNITNLQTQIDRTLTYEKNPATGDWFKHGVCVASNENEQGDDGEYDWQHARNIRDVLLSSTYTDVAELYDGTHSGGIDAPGNPRNYDLMKVLDDGVSVFNYTGHGNVNIILTTGFTNNYINQLNNANKLPFTWLVGCQTGNFAANDCFAEVLMRSQDVNGQPIGSIANFSSTINQYWDEPMEAQDAFNSILTLSGTQPRILRTFGGISFNGCISMNDKYGQSGFDMTDTWVCFGDPSLLVRTDIPEKITASHTSFVEPGVSSFRINCNTEGAQLCLYSNEKILGTATVTGGEATVYLNAPLSEGLTGLIVTVTAFNKIPYQKWVPLVVNQTATSNFSLHPNVITTGIANISYQVVSDDLISAKLYNSIGQAVKVFVNGETQPAGIYRYQIEGADLSSGVYIIELTVGKSKFYKKLIVN